MLVHEGRKTLADVNQPRLLSFSLDGWTGIGRKVTLTLTDGAAILVGRNGAGKSAILEGLESISSFAIGRFRRIPQQNDYDSIPSILDVSILTPDQRQLDYHYEFIFTSTATGSGEADESNADSSEEDMVSWNDRCQYTDGQRELLWSTEAGLTTPYHAGNRSSPLVLGSTTSFGRIRRSLSNDLIGGLPKEMKWVFDVLKGIRILGKVPVRQTVRRRPSLLGVSRRGAYLGGSLSFGQADHLARKILNRMENGELDELESVCQRIGVGQKITVQKFFLSKEEKSSREKEDEEYVSSVLLDGINIGLLSDGTLRVLSILIELLLESPSATTIIEEPEIQIHPGMLSKLLAEIESYTFGGNLIISTHSPQVVSWTTPEKINLVYRNDGQTFIRKLGADEIQNVVEYLCEEGDLGDWLYSGILDDE
jgi:predicted ATPase